MKIILWKMPGCPRCKGVEQQLRINGIDFEANEDANTLVDKGFTSAPVLQVNDEFLVGKNIFNWINSQK